MWKKLEGWKETVLCQARKEVLIKSVVQPIPTYIMGYFLLRVGLCEHIEALISRFWWGDKNGKRKIHWTHWSKLCDSRKDGGMGFWSFKSFNLAILVKQGWRMLHELNSLMAKTLNAIYFPWKNILAATVGFTPSYTWWSIHESLWVLWKRGYWRIGQGFDVYIWKDCWIPTQNGNKLQSLPNILEEDARVVELIDFKISVRRKP